VAATPKLFTDVLSCTPQTGAVFDVIDVHPIGNAVHMPTELCVLCTTAGRLTIGVGGCSIVHRVAGPQFLADIAEGVRIMCAPGYQQ
jgi:hypothetical protein